MVNWVIVAAEKLGLSNRDAQALLHSAWEEAVGQGQGQQRVGLKDLIREYTTRIGRPDEWDLVTDMSLYGDVSASEGSLTPEIEQLLLEHFGTASEIPSDGRLELAFSKSFHSKIPQSYSLKLIAALGNATEELRRVGGRITVVDWAWPNGLWAPTQGRVYMAQPPTFAEYVEPPGTTQQLWDEGGRTLGPRSLANDSEHSGAERSKPWRRLV
jgi:hypothetical protein